MDGIEIATTNKINSVEEGDKRSAERRVWAEKNLPLPLNFDQAVTERNNWVATALLYHDNESYYYGLLQQIAQILGKEAYTALDGTVYDTPLCVNIPSLVEKLVKNVRS